MIISNITTLASSAISILQKHVDTYGAGVVSAILAKDAKTTSPTVPDRDKLEIEGIGDLLATINPLLTSLSQELAPAAPMVAQ